MEAKYTCKDCGKSFESAKDFAEHFKRENEESMIIVGCKDVEREKG